MKNHPLSAVPIVLAALGFCPAVHAQSAPPPTAPASASSEIVKLDEFMVTAASDDGYKATNVLSGTRFNTSLLDLPKPIDVVTREFMDDIGARDITEALQYTSGIAVTRETDHAGKTDSDVLVRGFAGGGGGVSSGGGNQYINGYRTFGNFDSISIERIEVLKGPSSLFSGAIGAGGAINTVTRLPSERRKGSATVSVGSFDRYRLELEHSGPITGDKKLLYWVGVGVQDYGSAMDFANYRRVVVSPTLRWKATPKTNVTVFAQAMHNEQVPASHPVFMKPDLSAYLPNVSRSFNRMGPEAFNDSEQLHAIVDVVHKLNDTWTAKVGGIYRAIDGWRNLVTGGTTATINATTGVRTLPRSVAAIYQPEHGYAFQGYLLGKLRYAGLSHRAIAGYEYFAQASQEDVRQPRPNLTPINIDNPNYSLGDPLAYPRLAGRYDKKRLISRSYSLNNLWQAFEERLTVQFGYRRDETYQATDDFLTPSASFSGVAKPADLISGGVAVRVLPRVSLFVSYSESYEPLVKTDFFGRPFDPREGTGLDYGVKWDRADGRISATVTAFKVVNSNLEQADPDHSGFQLQTGENEAKGIEFSLLARPIKPWQVVGSYTHNKTRVVKDPRLPANVGLPTANAPREAWSLWNRYRFESGPAQGLGLGVGVVFVGERRGNPNLANNPGIRSPAYHRWQANASYATKLFGHRTIFALNVANLFDQFYRQSYAGLGEPRSFTGKVTFEF